MSQNIEEEFFAQRLQDASMSQLNSFKVDEIATLQAFLRSEVAIEEAANQITHNTRTASNAIEIDSCLSDTFNLLNDVAINLPTSQEKIINLLLAIQNLPDLEIPEADYMPVEQGDVFSKLPNFAECWSDQLNHSFNVAYKKKPATRDSERSGKEWSAVTAFTARLAACPNSIINSNGYFLEQGYDDIVLALEYEDMDLNLSVPATANWFLYAGKNIFKQVMDGINISAGGLVGKNIWNESFKTGGLSEGEAGLSLGRWKVWRARFEEVAEDKNVWEETRIAAREAVHAILKIEESGP